LVSNRGEPIIELIADYATKWITGGQAASDELHNVAVLWASSSSYDSFDA
jgi:hypothetical protein